MKRTIAFVLCVILDLIVIVYEKKRVKKKKKSHFHFLHTRNLLVRKVFVKMIIIIFFYRLKMISDTSI